MSQSFTAEPSISRDEFAALLDESLAENGAIEGTVVNGTIVAVENDFVLIDVGLKMEGRVPLKEFSVAGRPAEVKVGDIVEAYENVEVKRKL